MKQFSICFYNKKAQAEEEIISANSKTDAHRIARIMAKQSDRRFMDGFTKEVK